MLPVAAMQHFATVGDHFADAIRVTTAVPHRDTMESF